MLRFFRSNSVRGNGGGLRVLRLFVMVMTACAARRRSAPGEGRAQRTAVGLGPAFDERIGTASTAQQDLAWVAIWASIGRW